MGSSTSKSFRIHSIDAGPYVAKSSSCFSIDNAANDSNVANEPVKRICVVGVGPVGLGALKVITSAPEFRRGSWEVVAFEARDKIGGIWYYFDVLLLL